MSRVKGKDTKPEVAVRSALHRRGYRFRLHDRRLPGHPDIVLRKYNAVIQVRGCFWHSHDCKHGRKRPSSNKDYWLPKLERNKRRDSTNDRKLRKMGWQVIIVWECRCKTQKGLNREIERVERLLHL